MSVRSCVVSMSEIAKDPNHTLSAGYWCDKKEREQSGEEFKDVLDKEMKNVRGVAE